MRFDGRVRRSTWKSIWEGREEEGRGEGKERGRRRGREKTPLASAGYLYLDVVSDHLATKRKAKLKDKSLCKDCQSKMIFKNLGFSPTSGFLIMGHKKYSVSWSFCFLFRGKKKKLQLIHQKSSGQMGRGDCQRRDQQSQKVEKAVPHIGDVSKLCLHLSSRPSKVGDTFLEKKKKNS